MSQLQRQHDPTWPYEDSEVLELIESEPGWACVVGFCACHADPQTKQKPEEFSILLFDEDAVRMPGARCRVLMNGIAINEDKPNADREGWITVESRKLPEQVVVEWAPADTPIEPRFPFRKLFYVGIPIDDRDEAARRRLHNIGFSNDFTLEGNIREFQRAYPEPATGHLDDVEAKLIAFHDEGALPPRNTPAPDGGIDTSNAFDERVTGKGTPGAFSGQPPTPRAGAASQRAVRPEAVRPSRAPRFPVLVGDLENGFAWELEGGEEDVAASKAAASSQLRGDPNPILNTELAPFKWICQLTITLAAQGVPSGGPVVPNLSANATGFLITPLHILTAGHCVLTQVSGFEFLFRAFSVTGIPGLNQGKEPFPSFTKVARIRPAPEWETSRATNMNHDYALVTLSGPLKIGHWGGADFPVEKSSAVVALGSNVRTAGYPARFVPPPSPGVNPPSAGTTPVLQEGEVITGSAQHPNRVFGSFKASSGQSGSPFWQLVEEEKTGLQQRLIGIVSMGDLVVSRALAPETGAVRLTAPVLKQLRTWIREDDRTLRPPF